VRRAFTDTMVQGSPVARSRSFTTRSERPRSNARRHYRLQYAWMWLTDSLSLVAALLLAYQLRFDRIAPNLDFWLLLLTVPPVTALSYLAMRLYRAHQVSAAEEFRRLVVAVTLVVSVEAVACSWSAAAASRLWLLLSWALGLLLASSGRRLWQWRVRRLQRDGVLQFRTLIVGANAEAEALAETLRTTPLGHLPVGFVAGRGHGVHLDDQRVLGTVDQLGELVRETGADCLFVASSAVTAEDVAQVMKARRVEDIEVRFTATLPRVLSSRLAPQAIGGVMALSVAAPQLTRSQAAAKRASDLVLSGLGLLLLAPLLAAVALAITLTSPGPVIFRQERVGLGGRPFVLCKFRTMVAGADRMLGELAGQNEADGPLFKLRRDPRVTPLGRWLRRYSVDELPQLLNVLRGEMSLVGPRPPLRSEVARYEDWQLDRLEVRPGLTGLWQTSGRSELSFDEYVRLDLFYVENWSLAYDLYLLAKTIPTLLSSRGAF
jgi:exopolysaccharide biosynthesis polyprenyl glycosylphosphotransferase